MDRHGRSGFTMIRAAQRERERWVLREIRRAARRGELWSPDVGLTSLVTRNAVRRLEAQGKIRFTRRRRTHLDGYVVAA